MEKLLRKNGLDGTRFELKHSESSSKRLSSIKSNCVFEVEYDPDESMASTVKEGRLSKICQCKETSPENDRSLIHVITEEEPRRQFERSQRTEKPFFHNSGKKAQVPSNFQSYPNPTVQKRRPSLISPSHKRVSFSSKRQQIRTEPLQKGQQWQENISKKSTFSRLTENAKIQQIIAFLNQKLSYKCLLDKHERNRILYVCLEPNCQSRIGCSYCFLHSHENHLKSEISTCIKDLEELSFKVNASENIFVNKVRNFYGEFHEKLDHEVENIKMEFETNLSFVKMKVKNEFESFYKQKYLPYLEKNVPKISQFKVSGKIDSPQKEQGQPNSTKGGNEVKEKELLTSLVGFRMDSIYEYLLKRSQILHLEYAESKVLLQFFEEMNSSMTKFFSAFKRNLPKIFAQRIYLQKPLLISSS